MKMIQPVTLLEGQFFTNVPEDDHDEWSSAVSYSVGDRVIRTTTHKVYEALVAGSAIAPPEVTLGVRWVEVGATNPWKAFDQKISDPVEFDEPIFYEIGIPSTITGICFLGLSATQVQVQIFDQADVLVYEDTRSLIDTSEVIDWFSFFTFEPTETTETESLFTDVPGYLGNRIEVTVGTGTESPKIGQIILGKVVTLGETISGTSIGIRDFSSKERDDFGNAFVVERAFIDRTTFIFVMPVGSERRVKRLLSQYRARPALYFTTQSLMNRGATTYGYFQDFDIPLSGAGVSQATLEIEGLT